MRLRVRPPSRAGRNAPRMCALVDGYGADSAQRQLLPALIEAHTRGMLNLLRRCAHRSPALGAATQRR